jgi:hypothetical protein
LSFIVTECHALFILLGLLPNLLADVETDIHDVQPPLPVNGDIPPDSDADEESAIKDDEILEGPTVLAHVDLARTPRKFASIDCFRKQLTKISRTKACKKPSCPR